jgi:hypothetical protein
MVVATSRRVRRFKYVEAGLPDRPGINPFTRQPLVIPARPERVMWVDLTIKGRDVTLRWTRLEGGKPMGESHGETTHFADREAAEAYAKEVKNQKELDRRFAERAADEFRESNFENIVRKLKGKKK